ncbi:MAG TPA: hypothetical protein VJ598_05800, partial [Albitalea sp.]|nr:hypothetical protein [Albitalea sp.]
EAIAMVGLLDAADAAAEKRRGQITGKRLRGFVGAFKHDEALPPLQHMARSGARAARKVWNLLSYEAGSLFGRLITTAKLRLLRYRLDRQLPLPAFLRSLSVPQIYQYALFDAATRDVLEGDVALFRATQGSGAADDEPYIDLFSDPLFGWATHVHGRVHAFDVPGGHTSMLQEPNVHVLAERMQRYIDMSLAHAVRATPKETAAAERAITEEITECAESPAS